MLTLFAEQAECLWDESLPIEVRELPAGLVELDQCFGNGRLLGVLRWGSALTR